MPGWALLEEDQNQSPCQRFQEGKADGQNGQAEDTEAVMNQEIPFNTVRSIKADGNGGFTVLYIERVA
jgi:hypothetical protein